VLGRGMGDKCERGEADTEDDRQTAGDQATQVGAQ
jgi:hypothetical protein